jgi:AcrR family transcriptional regulator
MAETGAARQGIFTDEARGLGKSARTRARLMDAAVGVFARVGYGAASVNEIAQAADVANGTFYLHFKDKDEIAAAVAFRMAADVARQLDEAMADIDDAVERTSFATRQFIDLACSEPEWGWALFHASWHMHDLRKQVVTYLRGDLRRGVDQGVFKVELDDFLVDTFASMVVSALFGRLRGESGPEAGPKVAELQLRMLGVSPARAHRAAWRDIEPLKLRL